MIPFRRWRFMGAFTTQDASIELWGKEFVLSAEMQNTLVIFRARDVLDKTVDDYIQALHNKSLTLKQFCEKESPRVVTEVILPLCEPFVNLLNHAGIYNVDLEVFWKKYYVPKYLAPWEEAHDFFVEGYNHILEVGQEEFDFYEAQKRSRARIQGGGFGLLGAAKGILTAGVINALTGAAYDARNKGKQAETRNKMNYVFENAMKHPEAEEKLRLALKASLYNIIYATREIIEEKTEYQFLDLSEDTILEVDATINTLIKMGVKDERLEYEVMNLLQSNPYNKRIYHMAISMHGDPEHDLDIFGDLTGVDIRSIRNDIFIDTLPKIGEKFDDPNEAYEFMLEWAMHLGVLEEDFLKILQWN